MTELANVKLRLDQLSRVRLVMITHFKGIKENRGMHLPSTGIGPLSPWSALQKAGDIDGFLFLCLATVHFIPVIWEV